MDFEKPIIEPKNNYIKKCPTCGNNTHFIAVVKELCYAHRGYCQHYLKCKKCGYESKEKAVLPSHFFNRRQVYNTAFVYWN